MRKQLSQVLALALLGALSLFAWRVFSADAGVASRVLVVPPVTVDRVTTRLPMVNGDYLDPVPTNVSAKLSGTQGATAAVGLPGPQGEAVAKASKLDLKFGRYGGLDNVDRGKLVYVVTGDNLIPCPNLGGGVQNTSNPKPAIGAATLCQWSVMIDADTGEFLSFSWGPDVFCRPNRSGPHC